MSALVYCIANNRAWLEFVAGVSARCVDWAEFDSDTMAFAASNAIAVALIPEHSPEINQQLGRLSRIFPNGVLAEVEGDSPIQDEQFFAHGFQKLGQAQPEWPPALMNRKRCFEFRLQNYKSVPDWLNARFWAHPERFHL